MPLHDRAVPRVLVRALLPVAVLALLVAGLAAAPDASALTRREKIEESTRIALHQLGDRYRYGAEGPHRFDCSGLVYFAAHRSGLTRVPRSSSAQSHHMRRIRRRDLRRGDYLFFHDRDGVYHVGMFLRWKDGRRWMVHAPGRGDRVRRGHPWTDRWYAATLRR